VDAIDLYQLHWVDDPAVPLEDTWAAMDALRTAGMVRAIGVCNATLEQLEQLEAIHHVDSLQPPFSLIRRDAATDLLAWCAEHTTGVIVYSPMSSGLLTDAFDAARVQRLAAGDWRHHIPDFRSPHLERNLALRDALHEIALQHGVGTGAVAVAWTLAWPPVSGAIVGARSPAQVDGWLPAASIRLISAELDHIAAAIRATGAGAGPRRPGTHPPSRTAT
jgi:aryl-alcohol dehydrogenase-like predicted oxidoreductase